jgi:rhodanese-related sulfurtransferase
MIAKTTKRDGMSSLTKLPMVGAIPLWVFAGLLLFSCTDDSGDNGAALDSDTEGETDTDGDADADTDTDGDADTDTDVDADSSSEGDTDGETDTGSDADTDSSPEEDTDGSPDTDTDIITDTGADSETETEPDSETASIADAGEPPGTDWETDTYVAPDSESATTTESDAGIDTGADPDGDAGASGSWPDDKYISVDEVYARVQANDPDMLLINVVDATFYNLGHIEGSLKIPWDTLEDNLDQVDRTKHVVLYCRRGVRSEPAYNTLVDNGYPLVWVMEGGIESWTAAGYTTVPD